MDEAIVVPAMFFLTVIILTLGIPLVRAFARRQEGSAQHAPLPHDLTQRLDRIEAMVETVAVEVERLAEGQRFTTRLLSEGTLEPFRTRPREASPATTSSEVSHA